MGLPPGVAQELVDATKLRRLPNEPVAVFCRRLARAVDALPDDDWATLTEPAQNWVQKAIVAIHQGRNAPLPAGLSPLFGFKRDGKMGDLLRRMLITEPELGAKELTERLAAQGHEVTFLVVDQLRRQFLFALLFLEGESMLNWQRPTQTLEQRRAIG